jgi:hypothetical protein
MEQIERVCTDLSLKNNVKSLIRVIYESINIVLWQFVFIFVAHSKNLVNMNKFVSKLLLAIALQLIVCNFSFSQRGANWQVIPYASNVFKVIYHPFEYTREFNVTNAVIAKALGIDNICKFDFLSPPPSKNLINSLELLHALGALDHNSKLSPPLGFQMAEFPLHPTHSKALLASEEFGCAQEMITIIALLQVQHVFNTPSGRKMQADKAKLKFTCIEGDHLTLLNVYKTF